MYCPVDQQRQTTYAVAVAESWGGARRPAFPACGGGFSLGVALAGVWWGEGLCGDEARFHFLLKGCDAS